MIRRRTNRACAGFTLIEVMITSSLVGLVVSAILGLGMSGTSVFRSGSSRANLDAASQRAMERIVAELTTAGKGKLAPLATGANGETSMLFQQAIGVTAGKTDWTPLPLSLDWELETGELDNGIDDNGNGLVDEGLVVLTRDAGGPNPDRVILCRWVRSYLEGEVPNGGDDNGNGLFDERGFCFERVGDSLVIRLTLERLDSDGIPVVRSLETTVRLRN
jgi:prepilin-type N-terminal cleavage/methylation domain-containing protein